MQRTGVVYLSITAPAGDRLVSVSSADAGMAMLHRTENAAEMSTMADMDSLTIPPGKTVRLEPRGRHVMLIGLKHPLVAGTRVGLDLIFAKAGALHVGVPVLPIGAAGPP